jgi:hypothetical protein
MSDRFENQFSTGNNSKGLHPLGRMGGNISQYPARRRLIEECIPFATADLREIYKRMDLLMLANSYRPAVFRLEGHRFSLHLIAETIPRPRNNRHTGDETTRIWLICPVCFQRVRKVYTFYLEPGSSTLADLKCCQCHGLTYQSKNCSGNRWWSDLAMPLKKMLRRRRQLFHRQSRRSIEQLEKVEQYIWILRKRAEVRSRSSREIPYNDCRKRKYRDLSLIQ